MKRIYYQPRIYHIIAGIIMIFVGTFYFWFPFIINSPKDILDSFTYQILCNKWGIVLILLYLFFLFLFSGLIFLGIRFIIKSKNLIRLQLNEDAIIYYNFNLFVPIGRGTILFIMLYFDRIIEKKEIKYCDIADIKIKRSIWEVYFKIITNDSEEHNLPLVFPRKDSDKIIEFIKKKKYDNRTNHSNT